MPGQYATDGAGNRSIRQEIDDSSAQLSPLLRIARIGSAIHPLADSWSHSGLPDTPSKFGIRCRQPELVWSHPATRGGWKKHDADLTYVYPQDANETAETIYRYMLDFLDAHKTYAQRPPAAWNSLRKRVGEFSLRKTRDAKFDWFMEEDDRYTKDNNKGLPYDRFLTYPCFLEETSLPKRDRREDYPRTRCADPELKDVMLAHGPTPPPAPLPLQPDPDSPWYFSYRLLETWLVRRDVQQVLSEMSNVPGIASAFATGPAAISDTDLVSTLMNMWLVDDHGAINALGHGGGNVAALQEALNNPQLNATGPLQQTRYDSLADVASHPCSSLPFEMIRNDYQTENADGEPTTVPSYLVVFTLKHAPRDLLLLTIERPNQRWQLTSIAWAVQ